jgi:hypothetical protein
MLRFEPRTLHMLGKCSTNGLHPQPLSFETGSCYAAQASLKLTILLPPGVLDYRCEALCLLLHIFVSVD